MDYPSFLCFFLPEEKDNGDTAISGSLILELASQDGQDLNKMDRIYLVHPENLVNPVKPTSSSRYHGPKHEKKPR